LWPDYVDISSDHCQFDIDPNADCRIEDASHHNPVVDVDNLLTLTGESIALKGTATVVAVNA